MPALALVERLVQPRVLERDRGLRRDGLGRALGLRPKDAGVGVAEEYRAERHPVGAADGEVAPHGQVSGQHPAHVPVARV